MNSEDLELCKSNNPKLSQRRWVILVLLTLLQMLSGLCFACFGQISNFYVNFFDESYAQVDWMTVAYDVAPVAFALPLTWLTFRRIVRFRTLALLCALSFNGAFACIAISLMNTKLFWLSVVGQTLTGLSANILMATPSIFAVVWFPENELGTAMSLNLMGLFTGYIFGATLPTNLLTFHTSKSDTQSVKMNRDTLLTMFSACFVISLVICLTLCLIASDTPPNPPSTSQHLKRHDKAEESNKYWSESYRVLSSKNFLVVCVVFSAIFQAQTIQFTLMSEILKKIAIMLHVDRDIIGGNVIAFYGSGCILGTVPAAMLINRYKKFRLFGIIASWLVFLSASGTAMGVIFGNLVPVYVCNVAMGAFSQLAMVSLYGLTTESTQPMDETFVTLWFAGVMIPIGIIYGEVGRVVFKHLGSNATILFQAACMLMGAVLSCFLKEPKSQSWGEKNNNSNNNNSLEEVDESRRLIQSSSSASDN